MGPTIFWPSAGATTAALWAILAPKSANQSVSTTALRQLLLLLAPGATMIAVHTMELLATMMTKTATVRVFAAHGPPGTQLQREAFSGWS